MTRTPPSAADRQLIQACHEREIPLKASRLDAWRRHGLIPSPESVFLGGRRGSQRVYPPGTELQVRCLAVCDQLQPRMSPGDLLLLTFFAEMPLPFLPIGPLKCALAEVYFGARFQRQAAEQRAYEEVPDELREELPADFNWAETAAQLEIREDPEHVRQMRENLARLPDLARAGRQELNARVNGVLTALNRARLPVEDTVLMADLKAAMAFDGPPARSRAAWMHAALCRGEQLAVRRETNATERFDGLLALGETELLHFRELVLEAMNAAYTVASEGLLSGYEVRSLSSAKLAGGMLVEWNSMRQVVPSGSRPAQLAFEGLRSLWSVCSHSGGGGEGRARFAARTSGGVVPTPRPCR
uniref:SLV.5 n=1 Tax=Streptomyces lavendulae TaxID=1914 RepID=Q6RGR5_STRLA|nr:SLV.5 [Streptomyces lavendulae]